MYSSEEIIKTPHIQIKYVSPNIGRSVFSIRAFFKNEVVELSPIFLLDEKYSELPKAFKDRVFNWGHLTKTEPCRALALGYGSIYNHSDTPNLRYKADYDSKILRFITIRAIDPGEHLTIHYDHADGKHKKVENNWFEKHEIKKQTI
tara:strand:- start:25 stop:465 length:441 start_codon:yes stop_codon:yes gene_type:complete